MPHQLRIQPPSDRWRGHFSQEPDPFTLGVPARTAVVWAESEEALLEHPQLDAGWTLDHVQPPSDRWYAQICSLSGAVVGELEADSEAELLASSEGHPAVVEAIEAEREQAARVERESAERGARLLDAIAARVAARHDAPADES